MTAADIEGRPALNGAELRASGSGSRARNFWNVVERWRYRFVPDRLIGEILTKRWIDSAIPFTVLIVVLGVIGWLLPSMFQLSSLMIAARQLGEFGLVCLAMMVVVIAGGIDMLPGVLRAIRVRRFAIPDDISVVSVGDSELAQLHAPPISTIRWDQGEIGKTAAQLLLNRISTRDGGARQCILLPAEFVPRASVAPPRAGKKS